MVTTATVLFYIIFSVIKRFGDNPQLFYIPFILFIANCFIVLEVLIHHKVKKIQLERKNKFWLYSQLVTNALFAVLVFSYT